MHLTQYEKEKLLLHLAGELAQKRRDRGIKLNYPECVALIAHYVMEGAREGKSVAQLMEEARRLLKADQVMDGVPELLGEVQVEATFPDGTKLVTVHNAIEGNSEIIPGGYELLDSEITLTPNRPRISRKVTNTGSRPIQIGSHFHFYETNKALQFDRKGVEGYRLDIASGTSIRIEPGEIREVDLVKIGGAQEIYGFSGQTNKKITT